MKPNSKIVIWVTSILWCTTSPSLADQQYADIGDLTLVSGETIENCRVGYRTSGTLDDQKSNVIVMPTWFTGTSEGHESFGLVGPEKLADTDHYYVISIDALGNGVSCSPSNSDTQAGRAFPRLSTADMVASQHELLTEHLGIRHVRAVMGISMGGMQTFRWMAQYPEFMDKAIPIDGSPQMTSYDLLQWELHENIIRTLQDDGRSHADIMNILGPLNLLTLLTPENIATSVSRAQLPEYVANSASGYADFDWDDYVAQLQAMIDHDVLADGVAAYVDAVKADGLVIGVPSDHMVNPIPGKRLATDLDAGYFEVVSNCGHIGTSCEAGKVAAKVAEFLAN